MVLDICYNNFMTIFQYYRTNLLLAFGGVLLAGYMTVTRMISNECAFGESCPMFFGIPACLPGLVMFAIILLIVFVGHAHHKQNRQPRVAIGFLSMLGVVFSAYYTIIEIPMISAGAAAGGYQLGLPTCLYGLLIFIGIFVTTLASLKD